MEDVRVLIPLSPTTRRVLDVVLLVWVAVWIALGLEVAREVRGLSDLSETVVRTGVAVTESSTALEAVGDIPLVGDRVEDATQRVREAGESAQASGRSSAKSVENLSLLLGLALAVIPSLPIVGFYLPLRWSLAREARAVRRMMARGDHDHAVEVLAGRAVHTLPYRLLAHVSSDPIGDLRAGRYGPLATAELTRLGLRDEAPQGWLDEPGRAERTRARKAGG